MKQQTLLLVVCAAIICRIAYAQDPAEGWLAYATANYTGHITYMEAKWKVPDDPKRKGAFFSPWFGIEASDNLNLIQPVNPWSGDEWQIYNEYFQWEPEHNFNSEMHTVKAGDIVFGSVTYVASNNSYTIYHSDLNDGWSVQNSIPIQKAENGQPKTYNIVYFVFEKEYKCDYYPPNNEVTFFDIKVEYDGQEVDLQYTTSYVDNDCNCRAHVLNSTSIQITWDSTL
eukprot:TRINITY_DN477_c0_g1_i1.p1 TRINITY_DN477_c0_g1~~TRINITY_DN477_c0_g1_i1.p1  ORF type:complete len:227 (-),score=52.05 TRINITY_DN477_c0_g1_i1:105-785(-)